MTAAAAKSTPAPRPRLLLVDDDAAVTRTMSRLLEHHGWDVVVSNRAFGVLNLVDDVRPRVLILDMRMPGLDGAQVAELVRDDPDLASTRIVLCSGLDPDELRRISREVTADGWISKEEHPSKLVALLDTMR